MHGSDIWCYERRLASQLLFLSGSAIYMDSERIGVYGVGGSGMHSANSQAILTALKHSNGRQDL